MKLILHYVILIVFSSLSNYAFNQCSGGTLSGTLTPTAGYQTVSVNNGNYYNVNVSCGSSYNFTFCSDGGNAAWDTQITILDNTGATTLAYNDDNCGLQSNVSYTATSTGTIRVLISLYFCDNAGGNSATLAYNATIVPISPSFTISASSCTQATATITGSTGGTFSFNPVPSDGATINSTTGAISNGVPGTSYTVQYSVCGNTETHSVTMQNSNCWELNGNAQWITVGGQNCIQLTAEVNNQTGCSWDENVIDFNTDFTLSLDYYFGNNINGADGTSFTFQPNPGACGTNGGQLGAGGIANSLVIEFDTYDNDFPTHAVDISPDHIAVEVDGDLLNSTHLCGPIAALPSSASIDDGLVHSVDIDWNATTQVLTIFFDGNLRLTCNYDFVTNVFGGDNTVYWGATAATGGLNNQQYFCPQTVIVLPAELVSFTNECDQDISYLKWSTASENRVDYFEIESTTNGFVFQTIGKIKAAGTSTELLNYSLPIEASTIKRYFRIKTVDIDGKEEISDLISEKICGSTRLVDNYRFENNVLEFSNNNSFLHFDLQTAAGQKVSFTEHFDGSMTELQTNQLAGGIYFLTIYNNQTGEKQMVRVYHSIQ
ncbi:MAG: hypothetical protein RLZ33_1525 [Bacteroidota bacterium]